MADEKLPVRVLLTEDAAHPLTPEQLARMGCSMPVTYNCDSCGQDYSKRELGLVNAQCPVCHVFYDYCKDSCPSDCPFCEMKSFDQESKQLQLRLSALDATQSHLVSSIREAEQETNSYKIHQLQFALIQNVKDYLAMKEELKIACQELQARHSERFKTRTQVYIVSEDSFAKINQRKE